MKFLLLFCFLFISVLELTAAKSADVFPFTFTSNPPRVDGKIDANEYPTVIYGLIDASTHLMYPRESFLAVAADDKNIYIGASIEFSYNYTPVSTSNLRDDSKQITGGDTFNLFIRNDIDLKSRKVAGHYINIHPNGNIYDCYEVVDWKKLDCERTPAVNYNLVVKNSSKNNVWTVELRIPRHELKLDGSCPFAFAAGFRLQSQRYTLLDQPVFFDHNEGFGIGIFSKVGVQTRQETLNQGIVRTVATLNDEYGVGGQGNAVWKLRVPEIREVASGMVVDKHVGQEVKVSTKSLLKEWQEEFVLKSASVSIGAENEFKLNEPGTYCLDTTFSFKNKVIFNRAMPFAFFEPFKVMLYPVPSKDAVKASFKCYGVSNADLDKVSIAFTRQNKEYMKYVFPMNSKEKTCIFSMEKLVPGKYSVDVCLMDSKGKKIAGQTTEFTKLDIPVWLKERKGLEGLSSGWVPAPWIPVTEQNGIVSLWGRKYILQKGSLIKQLISQNMPLLASGINIKYLKDGKEYTINMLAPEFPLRDRGRLEAVQKGKSPHFLLTAKQCIEFDGMDRLALNISPGNKLKVDKLWLDIPLKNCSYMYTAGAGAWLTGSICDKDLLNPVSVWLGNDKAGLLIFLESYKGWLINSSKPRIVIRRHKDSAVLSLLLINEPSEVNKPMDLVAGLQVSPVKPYFAGWRNLRPMGWAWAPSPVNLWMTAPAHWTATYCNPVPRNPGILKAMTDYVDKHGQKVYPYSTPTTVSLYNMTKADTSFRPVKGIPREAALNEKSESNKIKEYWYFAEDWNTKPASIIPADTNGRMTAEIAKCSLRSSWVDYYTHAIYEVLKNSKVNGFYFDLPMGLGSTQYDERAYYTKDGKLEGFVDIFACRDLYKRLYFIFDKLRGESEKPYILGHGVPAMLPVCAFWDVAFHGEEVKPRVKFEFTELFLKTNLKGNPIAISDADTRDNSYNAASYRALYGPQFGVPHMLLPQYAYLPEFNIPAHSREILSFTFLHNNLLWPAYIPAGPIYDFWKKVEIPFGMGDTEFFPYWDNNIKTAPECVKLSYWKKKNKDKYLVAVSNWSDKPVEAGIKLPDFLNSLPQVSDMETGKKVNLAKEWTVNIPAHDLRVFVISKK